MPNLIIDNQEIEVSKGTKVITAAEQLGIMIPRFCYHPALGSVGACRVCAVKFLDGPAKGIQMSCMIEAQDGMVVSTTDAEVIDFRRHVIEWLMLNHPHDCPVCDEGGHCLLQDMTVSGGHGLRRYQGSKRTYVDQDLGPLVQHEMNRCIHCYRCSRYYQEHCGYTDLGAMRIGSRTYFGRFEPGSLESPFSGNLSDLCPTGVYTDKPARFKGRRWDFERTPSICLHCSLGCHVTVSARYREIVRHEARYAPLINGHFICDRGRFGFYHTEDPARPRRATIDGRDAAMGDALQAAHGRLKEITASVGPAAVACAGSVGSSLETLHAAAGLCRNSGWSGPSFFAFDNQARSTVTAVRRLDEAMAVSLRQMEKADFILAVGADPINEAPMLALAMRQAGRRGATIAVIDPRPVCLPFAFHHLPVHPGMLNHCLGAMVKAGLAPHMRQQLDERQRAYLNSLPARVDGMVPEDAPFSDVANRLQSALRPVIVCGTELTDEQTVSMAADAVLLMRAADRNAGLFYQMTGPNAFGAAMLGGESFDQVLTRIENGDVKALVAVEWDPLYDCPDRERVARALDRLDLLIVLDHMDTDLARRAHVLLPTTTVYESGGSYINQEGRLQQTGPAYLGGRSVLQTGGGGHPPRLYGNDPPDSDPSHAWCLLARLETERTPSDKNGRTGEPGSDLLPQLGLPAQTPVPETGVRVTLPPDDAGHLQPWETSGAGSRHGDFELLATAWTFGTERPSCTAPPLQQVTPEPFLTMHAADAEGLGIGPGDTVTVSTDKGSLTVTVAVSDKMARGVLVLPRHHHLAWRILDGYRATVAADSIEPKGDHRP